MKEIILIQISGQDKPGLTSSITGILSRSRVNILDVGQAVIHDTLSLGILVEVPESSESSPILKDVLFHANDLDLSVRFKPVSEEAYADWVSEQGKARYIVTLLARKLTAQHIAEVTNIVAVNGLNIDSMHRLSGRVPLGDALQSVEACKSCLEISLRGKPQSIDDMRADFLQVANRLNIDIAFQKDNAYRRNRRLVVFDMDSTLIHGEVIDELAVEAGVGDAVAAITEQAMQGKLDFKESFANRIALLKGLDEQALERVRLRLELMEGAEHLIHSLQALGYKTAILSGGFNYFGSYLKERLGIDYMYANQLEIVDGKVTGSVVGAIVDGQRKAELLKQIAKEEGINLEQVIAVGDGANDLPMLSIAGLGIAFRAKPLVKESAKQAISTLGLDGILYLLGVRDKDRVDLIPKR